MYLHEHEQWTDFSWDSETIAPLLASVRLSQGKLLGRISDLGFEIDTNLEADALTDEVLASSRIEGIDLDAAAVRSSVARSLGIHDPVPTAKSAEAEGAVDVLLDATRNFEEPFTFERLAGWHNALFPTGYSGLRRITVADYRTGDMRVVSGPIGHEKIHYEAPGAILIPRLMEDFLAWLNTDSGDPLLNAAIAHPWFLTIHPFDDGNGRIARALTEALLARSDDSSRRFYSMAHQILEHREGYYAALEQAQKCTPDITNWIVWFLNALEKSLRRANESVNAVLARDRWWRTIGAVAMNERQRTMVRRLLDDFEGKLTSGKWAKMCKVSSDTALRDITDLIGKGVLQRDESAAGRSTSYILKEL